MTSFMHAPLSEPQTFLRYSEHNNKLILNFGLYNLVNRQTDRQTNKQTNKQTDKQTNRQTNLSLLSGFKSKSESVGFPEEMIQPSLSSLNCFSIGQHVVTEAGNCFKVLFKALKKENRF